MINHQEVTHILEVSPVFVMTHLEVTHTKGISPVLVITCLGESSSIYIIFEFSIIMRMIMTKWGEMEPINICTVYLMIFDAFLKLIHTTCL